MIEAFVLGCGTSHGVPMIGCECAVCTSDNPRNKRTRSCLYLQGPEGAVLVDTPPELRLQMTREGLSRVDATIITHTHFDHLMGMDDLRRINEMTNLPNVVYAQEQSIEDIQRVYRYAFRPPDQPGGVLPSIDLRLCPDSLDVAGMTIQTFEVLHGKLPVLGLRIGDFAYLTDVSEIPSSVRGYVEGLDTLILDATRYEPHPSHFHFDRALEVIADLGPKQAFLTHLAHDYDYEAVSEGLPENVALSFDGLRILIQG